MLFNLIIKFHVLYLGPKFLIENCHWSDHAICLWLGAVSQHCTVTFRRERIPYVITDYRVKNYSLF